MSHGICDHPGCTADSTERDMRGGAETCPAHHGYERPRIFAPDSASMPVLAALETLNIVNPAMRAAAYQWAGLIACRIWGRPFPENKDRIFDEAWVVLGRNEEQRRYLGILLRENLERSHQFCVDKSAADAEAERLSRTNSVTVSFIDPAEAPADPTVRHLQQAKTLLAECATQFRFYEKNHRAKGTSEATEKADVNGALACQIEAFLGSVS